VLVDLDLRKPSIHRQLGITSRYGVGDFLRGSVSLRQATIKPGIDRLGVVLNQRSYPNSSEMLASPQAASLVEQTKRGDGRIVVFDLPPILASDDLLAFCPLVDAVLVVVAQGKTRQADMAAARELLQDVNVVGAVLNKSSEEVAPYYYYGQS
jgi:Mrp family chromosome partitioning ATPase